MSEELDFELVEDSSDQWDEVTIEADEETTPSAWAEEGSGDDTTPAKSNKSNFKKMSKLNKALIAENKRLKAEKAKATKAVKAAQISEDDFEDLDIEESFDKTEFRFFLIENPDAKEYSREIQNTIEEYPNLSFEDALALAKARKPKQSTSSSDFDTRSVNTKVKKKLADLTNEEALKLPNSKYLEYKRLKGTQI